MPVAVAPMVTRPPMIENSGGGGGGNGGAGGVGGNTWNSNLAARGGFGGALFVQTGGRDVS